MNKNVFLIMCALILFLSSGRAQDEGGAPAPAPMLPPVPIPPPAPAQPIAETKTTGQDAYSQDAFINAISNAYVCNPQLHAAVRQQYALAENVPTALAGWRPNLSSQVGASKSKTITDGTQQKLGTVPFERGGSQKFGIDSTSNTSDVSGSVTLSQNLFNGGQTVFGVTKAENEVLAGEAGLLDTEQQILLAAIHAYLDVWKNIKLLEFKLAAEAFQKSTLDQTRAQAEVGEKAITDVAQAEAAYAQAIVDRINAEAQLITAKGNYRQVIGLDPPENITPPILLAELLDFPKKLEDIKTLAADYNPKVINALYNEKAAKAAVAVAEGALLPSLDAKVSGSRDWRQDGNGKNTNKQHSRTNQGTVGLTLQIPLYQSGKEWSDIRRANQTRYQQRSTYKQQKLAAIQAAIAAWEQWQAAKDSIHQLEITVKARAVQVEGRRQQYLVGESTLTDLLSAESDLVQAQSSLVGVQQSYIEQGYTIWSTYGNLTPAALQLPVTRYDVKCYEEQVRGQFIGTGNLRKDLRNY